MQLQQVTIGKNLTFNLYDQGVSAGNPQPPFGEFAVKIDLNELLITTVKRLSEVDGQMKLTADKPNYPDVKVGDFDESMIWGMATNVIHQV